ncbi:MAG: fumarylacetoacetate hydrolase family protein [Bdellovibrionaceae bacterium]|nr:fumarylacetoacetate hydrolase family protein [Pseudobdellovibrionaceae bacterium]
MKLASLKVPGKFDGELILATSDLKRAVKATSIASSLREAVERWAECEPRLRELDAQLKAGTAPGTFDVKPEALMACLPRTWLFADGSAFIHHIKLVRKARNAALPETLETVPLMYQAESGQFLSPLEGIPQRSFDHGTDMEAEVGVITDFVPMGTSPEEALKKIRLVVLINDVSLRGLIPAELASGFGFFVSKPTKALSPFALTPDELGVAWKDGRLHLPLNVRWNDEFFGQANAGEMFFHFGQLIAHAAQTRNLAAGSLIGSGTVSNDKDGAGSSCIVEKRTLEQIEIGKPVTPYMKVGDRVEIWMETPDGNPLFGRIDQRVVQA